MSQRVDHAQVPSKVDDSTSLCRSPLRFLRNRHKKHEPGGTKSPQTVYNLAVHCHPVVHLIYENDIKQQVRSSPPRRVRPRRKARPRRVRCARRTRTTRPKETLAEELPPEQLPIIQNAPQPPSTPQLQPKAAEPLQNTHLLTPREQSIDNEPRTTTTTPLPRLSSMTTSLHMQVRNLQRQLNQRTLEVGQLKRQLEAHDDAELGLLHNHALKEARRDGDEWRERAEAAERLVEVFEKFTARLGGMRDATIVADQGGVREDRRGDSLEHVGKDDVENKETMRSPLQHRNST